MRVQVFLIIFLAVLTHAEKTLTKRKSWLRNVEQDDDSDVRAWEENVEWHGFKKSEHDRNSGNFFDHVYNDYFASFEGSGPTFTAYSTNHVFEIKEKLCALEQHALNGTLTPQNKTDWQPFATQLIYAFGNESAAMIYHHERGLWVVCGYVGLAETFVQEDVSAKACASCTSIGLQSPTREPILGKDYLLPKKKGVPRRSPPDLPRDRDSEEEIVDAERAIMMKSVEGKAKAVFVDLFGTAAMCSNPSSDDSCAAFCCYSEYETSDFCGGNSGTCL